MGMFALFGELDPLAPFIQLTHSLVLSEKISMAHLFGHLYLRKVFA